MTVIILYEMEQEANRFYLIVKQDETADDLVLDQ